MNETQPAEPLQLRSVLRALARRRAIVLACIIVAPAIAITLTLVKDDVYRASSSLLFRDPGFDQKVLGTQSLATGDDPTRQARTNLQLVSLAAVSTRAARALRGNVTAGEIKSSVKIGSDTGSNLVNITASRPDPVSAARFANAIATQYIAFRRDADRDKILQARHLIDGELAALDRSHSPADRSRVKELRTRAERLDILASLQTGNAEVVQFASVPSSPVPHGLARKIILAILAGGLFGIALALLVDRLDRRLHSADDAAEAFNRPILGTVALHRGTRARQALQSSSLHTPEAESFRLLRANLLYFNVNRPIRSVLVTSSMAGEGKSTVSWNLALAAAGSGTRVMLIEADLRHPSLAARLDLPRGPGLSAYLAGNVELSDVTTAVRADASGSDARSVDLVVAGNVPPNPSDLVGSEAMLDLVRYAEQEYDLVVIDTPPATIVSDAISLMRQVSGVLLVGRIGLTTRDAAKKITTQLENVGASVFGVVVNGVPKTDEEYYGYGYRTPYAETEAEPAAEAKGESKDEPKDERAPTSVS
jgi:capsular exopolysaccharide synthesis family protein